MSVHDETERQLQGLIDDLRKQMPREAAKLRELNAVAYERDQQLYNGLKEFLARTDERSAQIEDLVRQLLTRFALPPPSPDEHQVRDFGDSSGLPSFIGRRAAAHADGIDPAGSRYPRASNGHAVQ